MLSRILKPPKQSILLLGPRGTGKSTWIGQHFSGIPRYDLLNGAEALRLAKNSELLYLECSSLKARSWVIIDEVQKVPGLLDEVHRLIEEKHLRFILCGSSARKLKRGGANLLAGRALIENFFPLVSAEVDFKLSFPQVLQTGMLPLAFTQKSPQRYLQSYAETYLQEEIKQEALSRSIGSFARFLEIAARQNGQLTSFSNIASDAHVARQTVSNFFEILVDTLIGTFLPPWELRRSTKQVRHPKFYFFDCGVARVLSGRLPYPPTAQELGPLLETFILSELKAYLSYRKLYYPLFFWSSHEPVEVDILFETKKGFVAIEIKSIDRWERRFNRGLKRVAEELGENNVATYGIYLGVREMRVNDIQVLPVTSFLKKLWKDELI